MRKAVAQALQYSGAIADDVLLVADTASAHSFDEL
jgi:hypothetical protein